ncbi:AraC family transcriptional regulator [Pedobacter frigidisoli]|uniref:AraC family transcriptional regulator n=1 Tax=Pedobacter frigidisoli TaxID=2530455 RepID=A0A4R0NCI7_9SPHI|nr:helix-turn-helix transcriptional regulator [Pedobacter frigidisoli]TCC97958.1 AraC family transcriptional regulator [Pedobacter frigidisoli]
MLTISSISEQHQLLGLGRPDHPLISIVEFDAIAMGARSASISFINKFYTITLKPRCISNEKYGRNRHDFNQGMMNFCAPDIKRALEPNDSLPEKGWLLNMHPDFLIGHPLHRRIMEHGFFHYEVNEALHLSPREEQVIARLLDNIRQEYLSIIDPYSQDIILSQVETLLNYANRFYNRQFITRKSINGDLLIKLDLVLDKYFEDDALMITGQPSVKLISEQMNISPNYLSDLLRNMTGQNTQQHIQNRVIKKAKHILLTSDLSVSEVAYKLGFEHTQSFNKLFKNKTKTSPLEFKNSFN